MKIAITGLGRMGSQIAEKLAVNGHEVIAHNRSRDAVNEAINYGALAAYDKQSVINAFDNKPVILWIMIPAESIDSELEDWLTILPAGSIVIDGGNSDYRNDKSRSDKAAAKNITMLDIGTSGGIWGLSNGFSLMIGGDNSSYETVKPILDALGSPNGGHKYFGETGTGHYVKMVHNAIEYGIMESLAEGYRLMKEGPYKNLDLASAGDIWQRSSVINSRLNDFASQALHANPDMNNINGIVAESGETRWALETAAEHNIKMPAVQASLDVRLASQNGETNYATKLLAAMRNRFGGHNING